MALTICKKCGRSWQANSGTEPCPFCSKENIVVIRLGDWSADGHGMTETFNIRTPFTLPQIEEAYKKGVELFGIDISKDWCSDYEQSEVSKEDVDRLPFPDDVEFEEEWDDPEYYIFTTEDFLICYLAICNLGDPTFSFEILEYPIIDIGGYGLFAN